MWHRYETRGIVLARSFFGEANVLMTLMTQDLGLVRASAQGARLSGAKLAGALSTFVESGFVLVRGKGGWRLAGAIPFENWFVRMRTPVARERAGRVSGLFLPFAGEAQDPELFPVLAGFFEALAVLPEEDHDAAEVLAVLRLLATLGLDTGGIPGKTSDFTRPLLADIARERAGYVARINRGILASGL